MSLHYVDFEYHVEEDSKVLALLKKKLYRHIWSEIYFLTASSTYHTRHNLIIDELTRAQFDASI